MPRKLFSPKWHIEKIEADDVSKKHTYFTRGKKEGREEGREETLSEMVDHLIKKQGMTPEEAKKMLGLD